nr:hypothetical protein BaRGS_026505 [Batillaria attramentaria]
MAPVYLDSGCLLAFRVTPGIGVSAFDTYMRTGYDDDNYTDIMLRCPLLLLLLSLVAIDTAWSKGQKDVMNKKQLTAAVKNIQKQMESRDTPVYLDNGYLLAFRVTPGIGVSVFDTYMRAGYDDDNYVARLTMPCGCTSVDGSQPCDRHYRGKVLDTWSNIDRVRVSLYEGGEEKAFVEFDGNDSSFDSWFMGHRLDKHDDPVIVGHRLDKHDDPVIVGHRLDKHDDPVIVGHRLDKHDDPVIVGHRLDKHDDPVIVGHRLDKHDDPVIVGHRFTIDECHCYYTESVQP